MAGISIRTIQRIERGAHASPEALKCIASIRETDFENLWTEQEMPNAEQPKFPRLLAKEKEAWEYVSGSRHLYASLYHCRCVHCPFDHKPVFVFRIFLGALGRVWLGHWPPLPWPECLPIFNLFGDIWEIRQIERRMRRQR